MAGMHAPLTQLGQLGKALHLCASVSHLQNEQNTWIYLKDCCKGGLKEITHRKALSAVRDPHNCLATRVTVNETSIPNQLRLFS